MSKILAALRIFLGSIDGWSIITCAVGAASGLLPWAVTGGLLTWPDNAFGLTRWTIPCWFAVMAVGAFGVTMLTLIITFRLGDGWKPALLVVTSVVIGVAVGLFFNWTRADHADIWGAGDDARRTPAQPGALAGPYVALACVFVLLLLAAIKVRTRRKKEDAAHL